MAPTAPAGRGVAPATVAGMASWTGRDGIIGTKAPSRPAIDPSQERPRSEPGARHEPHEWAETPCRGRPHAVKAGNRTFEARVELRIAVGAANGLEERGGQERVP